jgi:transposase
MAGVLATSLQLLPYLNAELTMAQRKIETSNDDRKRIIKAYLIGRSATDIAAFLSINPKTVCGIISLFRKENQIEKKTRGGNRAQKLTNEEKSRVLEWVDKDCSLTLKALSAKCLSELNISAAPSTIGRVLRAFHYSLKRIHLLPERRNDEQALDIRAEYANAFMTLLSGMDDRNIFFVDEVGFNAVMRARRGRSLVGTRAVHEVTNLRSRNISICCAISKYGLLKYDAQTRPYNGDTFRNFMTSIFQVLASQGIARAAFIMDNVPFHKSIAVRDLFEREGHLLLFLPPYSPFLNPIENMFSKWKQGVCASRPVGEVQLMEHIDNGARFITAEDCSAYYRHMLTFIARSMRHEVIIDE